eukprot:Sspe_Gene.18460::Locus_6623_Transcript_1_1_Confidence_1.000_Length_3641::g.18460::m.18460
MEGIEGELECAICHSLMADPRVLSCQHSFCLRCLHVASGRDRQQYFMVKCPFSCPTPTEVSCGIRSLKRNTLITNISHSLRSQRFNPPPAGLPCDACSAETPLTFCPQCTALLCSSCIVGEDHSFVCSSVKDDTKVYPFFCGWSLVHWKLRKRLAVLGYRRAKVLFAKRLHIPCFVERVRHSVRVGDMELKTRMEVPVFDVGQFKSSVEREGHRPVESSELSILFRLQETRSRETTLIRTLDLLLSKSCIASTLDRNSMRIDNALHWDYGFSNDCVMLSDMMLTVHNLVYRPLTRKISVLAMLEGLRNLQHVSENTSELNYEKAEAVMSQQIQLLTTVESFLERQNADEVRTAQRVQKRVRSLLLRQHSAYSSWREGMQPVVLQAHHTRCTGQATVIPRDCDGLTHVVAGIGSGGRACYTFAVGFEGVYTVLVKYLCGEDERGVTVVVNGKSLPPMLWTFTGGWTKVGTYQLSIGLLRGTNEIVFHNPQGCAPDIGELQVTYSPVGTFHSLPPAERSPKLDPHHLEACRVLGVLHHLQLQVVQSLLHIHEEAWSAIWDRSHDAPHNVKDKAVYDDQCELLGVLKNIQQARIFQRQYFNCALVDGHSLSSHTSSTALFPVVVLHPQESPTPPDHTFPNLLQALLPRIRELREQHQSHVLRDPGNSILCKQLQILLEQTLDAMNHEHSLQLREGVQIARHILRKRLNGGGDLLEMLYMASFATSSPEVESLQLIQSEWTSVIGTIRNGGMLFSADSDNTGGNSSSSSSSSSVGTDMAPVTPSTEQVPPESFASSASSDTTTDHDTIDLSQELVYELCSSFTRGVVRGMTLYTDFIKAQRSQLDSMATIIQSTESSEVAWRQQTEIAVVANKLELHLRVVGHMQILLQMAQNRSAVPRLRILHQLIAVLRMLHQDPGFMSSPTDKGVDRIIHQSRPESFDRRTLEEMQHYITKYLSSDPPVPWAHVSHATTPPTATNPLLPPKQDRVPPKRQGIPALLQHLQKIRLSGQSDEPLLWWVVHCTPLKDLLMATANLGGGPLCWESSAIDYSDAENASECNMGVLESGKRIREQADLLVRNRMQMFSLTSILHMSLFSPWLAPREVTRSVEEGGWACYAPFYTGKIIVEGDDTQHVFLANGQTGTVFVSLPRPSLLWVGVDMVKGILRHPVSWVLGNAAVIYYRYSRRNR